MEGILSRDEFADRTVPSYILQYLATELAEEWQTLARCLNISEVELYIIKANHSGRMQDMKRLMLRHWTARNGAGATYRVLVKALDKAGRRDLREYVERQVEQQEEKGSDVPSKGKAPDPSSVKQPSTSASDRVVTDATIQDLSIRISREWKDLGRNLRLMEVELDNLQINCTNHYETAYQMLLTWKARNGMKATYRVLGEALRKAGRVDLQEMLYKQVEQQEDKSGDVSSKGKDLSIRISREWKDLGRKLRLMEVEHISPSTKKQQQTNETVEQQEDKSSDFSSKGKPPDVLPRLHESLQRVFAEMTSSDSENLANFFMFPLKHVKAIVNSPSHSKDLLVELENKGIIQSALTDELFENLGALNILTGRNEGSKSSICRPSSTFLSHEEVWKPPDTMKIKSSISEKGGLLQIPNTGIKLVFPPNAVTEERNIQIKIIPPSLLNEPATSFSSNSSVVLELLPNGLQLKRDVSLTLPHCLTFANEENAKAKVYVSHHEEGQRPRWEERPLSPYIFYRSRCTVRLLGFCWLKIKIDDREVVAKNIVVYAAKKILQNMETSRVSYGYYEDIPDREPKILNLNPDLKLVQSLLFTILKEGKQPITISFNGTYPRNSWAIEEGNEKQEMPWRYIDLSKEFLVHFELQRRQSRDSFCKFTAQQGNSDPIKFSIAMEGYLSRGEIADSSVPDYILQYLAEELCSEWQSLARYLKISQGDLDNVKEDNRRCHQDTKYFMLDKWKKRNGTGATCRVLATALDKAGRRDLREYVESQVPMQSGSEPTHQHGWFRGWLKWFKW